MTVDANGDEYLAKQRTSHQLSHRTLWDCDPLYRLREYKHGIDSGRNADLDLTFVDTIKSRTGLRHHMHPSCRHLPDVSTVPSSTST